MKKLSVFNFLSIDGYYKSADDDISWNKHGAEEAAFSEESLKLGNTLLFGRKTFQLMESFWTTEEAFKTLPVVAEGMNKEQKIVFSNTLGHVTWSNTKLVKANLNDEIIRLKRDAEKDITILGSGTIVTQLAQARLIDEYQLMIYPVALGSGVAIFNGIKGNLNLALTDTKVFKSGTILLTYKQQ